MRVLKFGGSSLASVDQIRQRAKQVAAYHQKGEAVIVVVSAMGSTTNDLAKLANSISNNPHRRELDMLLTTGERVSMALMSMALNELGCPAISFTGSQAGILTEQEHNDAYIKEIKPFRVAQELEKNKVVVVAGFQGVDPITKEVTTLGRGGSDTTAIALAHHFEAKHCQILKDVSGVYTADPKFVPNAKPIDELHFSQLLAMCQGGAKVLHTKAIEMAYKLNFPFEIGLADDPKFSTKVSGRVGPATGPLAVNYILDVYSMNLINEWQTFEKHELKTLESEQKSPSLQDALQRLRLMMLKENLTPPQFLQMSNKDILIYGDTEILHPFSVWCHDQIGLEPDMTASLVTVTFAHAPCTKEIHELNRLSNKKGESLFNELGTQTNLSFMTSPSSLGQELKALHDWIK